MTALNEIVDLVKIQPVLDFEDIQLWEDEEFLIDILEDLIDIDGSEDDIKNDGLLNKPLNKGFYLTLPPSVYDYLDYTDFFISIRFEGVEKGVIAVIAVMPITAGTPLTTTAETTVTPGKGAIAVIAAIPVTAGTPLVTIAETAATPGTRSDQIGPSKGVENTLGFKIRFYNDVIVIKESNDIYIIALNNKAAIPGATTLKTSQPMNQILEYERITYPQQRIASTRSTTKFIYVPDIKVFDWLIPPSQQPYQITETELNQINPIKDRPKLYSSFPNDNLGLYTVSDIPPDKTV